MTEEAFKQPAVTTDVVLIDKGSDPPEVLLVKRAHPPFAGCWALPGGFLEIDEGLMAGAARELAEETGLRGIELQQLGAFGKPDRDPRGRTISIAYFGVMSRRAAPTAGSDASAACWHRIDQLPALAFDHAEIINVALRRAGDNRRT